MSQYILSIDQGTTSSRAIIFNEKGDALHSVQQEFPQYYPKNGWVEHCPDDILNTVLTAAQLAIEEYGIGAEQVTSVGICNQRETTLVWDKTTGLPVYNAIVWQDRRTAPYCRSLIANGKSELINRKTGLLLDAYFSATKIRWILDNVEGAREKVDSDQLAFGTVDTFLLWHLTDGRSHLTDATNASRTLLYNIHEQCWDDELLALFNIPKNLLPGVRDSAYDFGTTNKFGAEIAIQGIAGDQQAAMFGQTCFAKGMAKSTYGTGCFLMVNTGERALASSNRLLTTIGYQLNGKATYALEGSIFIAGAAVQWMRDNLKLFENAADTEQLADLAHNEHGVYFVPAFTGLGAPYWDPDARGAILGLTRATGINEIVCASIQSVGYQTKDLMLAVAKDGIDIHTMRVDGGMADNNWFNQFLSDILAVDIDRPHTIETSALGVAYLAGLQAGVFESLEHIQQLWQTNMQVMPNMDDELRTTLYNGWLDAVSKVITT
ncbi:glycerol kinase GlpK [Thalassotalea maritima]|uniref:glycerol kinase GlpK n=1 Tax=Thalassotalea maritima TaxID=3242416 RepID=UPI00352826E0